MDLCIILNAERCYWWVHSQSISNSTLQICEIYYYKLHLGTTAEKHLGNGKANMSFRQNGMKGLGGKLKVGLGKKMFQEGKESLKSVECCLKIKEEKRLKMFITYRNKYLNKN